MPFRLLYFYLLVKILLKYQNLRKLALLMACKAMDDTNQAAVAPPAFPDWKFLTAGLPNLQESELIQSCLWAKSKWNIGSPKQAVAWMGPGGLKNLLYRVSVTHKLSLGFKK